MTITGTSVLQRDPGATVTLAPYGPRGPVIIGTSSTPITVATGPVTFTMVEYGLGFAPGIRVRATAVDPTTGAPTTNWVEGVVTDYSTDNTLDVTVDLIAGTGIWSSWQITVAGQPGLQGPTGPTGATGQVPEAPSDHIKYARMDAAWVSVTADLNLKAPILSPIFTGDPQSVTPATADNDTSIATTAYVKANLALAQPLDADLTSLAGASVTAKLYYRKAADTWVPLTMGSGITLDTTTDTLNVIAGGGNVSNSGTPVVNDLAQWASTNTIKSLPISGLYNGVTFTGTTTFSGPAIHSAAATFSGPATFSAAATAPTPAANDNSTTIATTAYVRSVVRETFGVRGLTGSANGTTINLAYQECLVRNAAGVGYLLIGPISGAISPGTVGANGCDVALTDGDVSFYTIWGATPGAAFICSNANPATGPALPSGFTHWGYLTTVKRSSGNFFYVAIRGNKVIYANAASILSGGSSSAWATVSASAYVPSIATNMMLNGIFGGTTSSSGGGALWFYLGWNSTVLYSTLVNCAFASMANYGSMQAILPNVNQTVWWCWADAGGAGNFASSTFSINVMGFEVPNNT